MAFVHEPVLLAEVLQWMNVRENGVYADGTLGGGGHSGAMLEASGGTATLYGIDRDENAIAAATARLEHYPGFHAIHGNFHDAKALLSQAGAPPLDGALLDLGVSSPQLDQAERGFSYHEDAPLDMRMDRSQGMTAAGPAGGGQRRGTDPHPPGIRRGKMGGPHCPLCGGAAANAAPAHHPDLVRVVDAAIPKAVRRKDDGHPARRTFQAVRHCGQ